MPGGKAKPHIDEILSTDNPVSPAEFDMLAAEARQLITGTALTDRQAGQLAAWAAAQFWVHYLADGSYLTDAITLLCEMATQSDPIVAQAGQKAIFSTLVERLSDSFNPGYCALYDCMFVQIIDWCRRQPDGVALHRQLSQFGLHTAQDLLERKRQQENIPNRFHGDPKRIRKIILLSRVTLGAEVAITATLIANVQSVFKNARYVILAAPTICQIFAGDRRISLHEVHYQRGAGLIEQFNTWLHVVQAIRTETEGLHPHEFIVVDSDSRLTQLGLLPVLNDESRYFFFPSRSFGGDGTECIGELTNRWANQTFGGSEHSHPQLSLADRDWDYAQTLRHHFREAGASHVVTVNFGVGGNMTKRLSEDFEHELVLRLLESGSHVLLAEGLGEEEIARSNRLLKQMTNRGKRIREKNTGQSFDVLSTDGLQYDILAWQGHVGAYCALIGNSDEYIGYDSGGQHIAAALGTPTVDIFAHSPYPLFMQRWRPYGSGTIHVIDAISQNRPDHHDFQTLLDQVMTCHEANRRL